MFAGSGSDVIQRAGLARMFQAGWTRFLGTGLGLILPLGVGLSEI